MSPQRFIVAELSKCWPAGDPRDPTLIAQLFERALEVNTGRGYLLHSWRMVTTAVQTADGPNLVETIVAVFELESFQTRGGP